MRGAAKLTDEVRTDPLKNARLLGSREERQLTDSGYLVCPDCVGPPEQRRLVAHEEHDDAVECLRCGYECQDFIKDPVASIYNHTTGEWYLKNVWTGERVE